MTRTRIPQRFYGRELTSLSAMSDFEQKLDGVIGVDSPWTLSDRFPWLLAAEQIADQQGFFHWELTFAQAFTKGGFDLQVGNPPWVRPDWDAAGSLAEEDPWFKTADRVNARDVEARRANVLESAASKRRYLTEFVFNTGLVKLLGSGVAYPFMDGTRPDLYRAFMCRCWGGQGSAGVTALVHPDTHFVGVRENHLRAQAYRRLRLHAGFVNAANWAFVPPVGRNIEFGLHVYGPAKGISFLHLSKLYGIEPLSGSLLHDGSGAAPGQKFNGAWDLRPHASRVIVVEPVLLAEWQRLRGEPSGAADEAQLLYPITTHEQGAIEALSSVTYRLGARQFWTTSGLNEKTAKDKGLIEYGVDVPP